MSFLPTMFLNGEARGTVINILGDMAVASKRWGQFAWAYRLYGNTVLRNIEGDSASQTYSFPNGDVMTITSKNGIDNVTITVKDTEPTAPKALQGFLIVPMDGTNTGPDRNNERVYPFDFDRTNFAASKTTGLYAGNTRKYDGYGKYFTWDGTGAGDMAHEPFELIDGSSGYLQNPNAFAQPYAALTGWVYCDGVGYEVLNGQIYGMRVRGNSMLIADFKDATTVRIHSVDILRKNNSLDVQAVRYVRVLGTAQVTAKAPVNFSQNMKQCVVGDTIIDIESPFSADRVFPTAKVPTTADYQVVRSGYAANTLYLTTRRTTRTGAMSNFTPRNAAEYGLPDSNYGPIDTHGHIEYEYEYFDIVYIPGNVGTTPTWTGKFTKDNHSTIIKQPMLVAQGISWTTVYAWLRTISVTTISDTNRLYWYKDYDTGDFVRLNWSSGYVSTVQYEAFGIPEPIESAVATGRGLNVGGYVVEGNDSPSNWFYAVTNGKGDYILRTKPNGQRSDALLVSKTGQTMRVADTYSVGII